MPAACESDLYAPLKAHLEGLGFNVRAEVGQCDAVARRGDLVLALEMKLSFGLPVLHQALERLSSVDLVYVAVAVPAGRIARTRWDRQLRASVRLCRMLGLGLLSVRDGLVVVHAEPGPYQPRKHAGRRAKLLGEFDRRSGDHNVGGTSKRPRVTAYRENALRCAHVLANGSVMKVRDIRAASGADNAAGVLRDNVYGWFDKVERGAYRIAPAGRRALEQFADVVRAQAASHPDAASGE